MAPILLLGGAFQDMYSWRRHEEVLVRHADVVTVDLPGWGGADHLPADVGVDFLVDTAAHALDQLGVRRVNVAGCSYGSLIAHRLAQRYPERVLRLALNGVATGLTADEQRRLSDLVRSLPGRDAREFAETVTARLSPTLPGRPVRRGDVIRQLLVAHLSDMTADARRKFVSNTMRLCTSVLVHAHPAPPVPTVMFTGADDTFTPPEHGHRLAQVYPHATCVTIAEADHLLLLQRDAEFCELLITHFGGGRMADLPFCLPCPRGHQEDD
ncbi:MAG TPA: alpha/beta hydrolase [Yinghuangia sp.]|uniref:alpha/beta fold hydrolase n=1 Tax=Yinghuangia sp. YIM S10712 TaxID=3436930 RepID=UPI002CD7A9CE|nr:alpha/beta hydrolase [Yinghuangia sp.]